MSVMAKRTDLHRPGAIVPTDYAPVHHYSLSTTQDGWPVPSYGVNCELDGRTESKDADSKTVYKNGEHRADGLCCIIGMRNSGQRFAATGGTGKCSVCGAHFVYGQVWRHEPSGELIHIGHDCADKYEFFADDPTWCAGLESLKARRAAYIERLMRDQRLADAYAAVPGLEDALSIDHHISADLRDQLRTWGRLSEKQIALAFKLRADSLCPERPKEVNVPAPTGRITVRGVLVSKKAYDGAYGTTIKGTVKVATPQGAWLAWGTLPAALLAACPEVGAMVEFTATLKPGRDAHFALASRPTGGRIIT